MGERLSAAEPTEVPLLVLTRSPLTCSLLPREGGRLSAAEPKEPPLLLLLTCCEPMGRAGVISSVSLRVQPSSPVLVRTVEAALTPKASTTARTTTNTVALPARIAFLGTATLAISVYLLGS
jgi:hypothetical protein